jgi:hypothetical protein
MPAKATPHFTTGNAGNTGNPSQGAPTAALVAGLAVPPGLC